MQSFTLNGITLEIPEHVMTDTLIEALVSGRYEGSEAAALTRHLRPGDRMLELGSGAGYLAALAAGVIGAEAVLGVEAHPEMAQVARANLKRNDAGAADILWGAAVADDFAADAAPFWTRMAYWASALATEEQAATAGPRLAEVPALRIGALIARHRPTVLVSDIEGGELALFDRPLAAHIRLLVLEIHPGNYGLAGVKRIFDALSAQGLVYCAPGSRGDTLVFERLA